MAQIIWYLAKSSNSKIDCWVFNILYLTCGGRCNKINWNWN